MSKIIDAILRMIGLHDSYGLRKPTGALKKAFPEIVDMPITKQAGYADKMVHDNVMNAAWVHNQMVELDYADVSLFEKFNATTIGNLAYISLFCPDIHLRDLAHRTLIRYKHWYHRNKTSKK